MSEHVEDRYRSAAAGGLGRPLPARSSMQGIAAPHGSRSVLSAVSKPDRLCQSASWTPDNQALADRSDVIIVSVRPVDWPISVSPRQRQARHIGYGGHPPATSLRHSHQDGARCPRPAKRARPKLVNPTRPGSRHRRHGRGDRSIVRRIFDACGIADEVHERTPILTI